MTTFSSPTLSEDDLQEIQDVLDIPLSGSADLSLPPISAPRSLA
ncbi:hypothetical protein [Scandinavium tedordense]|nr:hypothetical protein [Scandinavium tedordense]